MAKRPDLDTQAQIVIYAAVHGDGAACRHYGLSDRSLRRYRALAREEGSELSETVRRYARALSLEERAGSFAHWLLAEVRRVSDLFLEKAAQVDARNAEALRAINEHMAALLEHAPALTYIERLFGHQGEGDTRPEGGGAEDR